jgi:pimeloyl-ACP methyl ester carboxylesterase
MIDLPLSRLHIMEAGSGPLLVMLPATISEVDDYQGLVQFMAQWFHVVFFELPGHGRSSPFPGRFSSHMVAELVEQLVDALGYQHFNLQGFSFGGILALRTFVRLSDHIDRLIMNAPCLGPRTLSLAPSRQKAVRLIVFMLDNSIMHWFLYKLAHSRLFLPLLVKFLGKLGRLERTIPLKEKLTHIQPTTLAVLNAQIMEILTTEFEVDVREYDTPCYFNMSIHDPLLQFDVVLEILQSLFTNTSIQRLTYPYHQPPQPFTFDELNRDFSTAVDAFMHPHPQVG